MDKGKLDTSLERTAPKLDDPLFATLDVENLMVMTWLELHG